MINHIIYIHVNYTVETWGSQANDGVVPQRARLNSSPASESDPLSNVSEELETLLYDQIEVTHLIIKESKSI